MTTLEVEINGDPRWGLAVKKLDYVNENDVARCTLTLADTSDGSTSIFPNSTLTAGVNGTEIFRGYIDDISPHASDPTLVWEKDVELKCRGYGRALIFNFLTKTYPNPQLANWPLPLFIDDALKTAHAGPDDPGGLTVIWDPLVTPPVTFPSVIAKLDRTYLVDALREICATCEPPYDFTVDNNQRLRLWEIQNTPHSGVTLSTAPEQTGPVAGLVANNILLMESAARVSSDLKNHIRVDAGDLSDDWTETNASDWTVATLSSSGSLTCTLVDDVNIYAIGKASIRADILAAGAGDVMRYVTLWLEFPRYNQEPFLDLSNVEATPCRVFVSRSDVARMDLSLYLMDSQNREMRGTKPFSNQSWIGGIGAQLPSSNRFHMFDFKLGYDSDESWVVTTGGSASEFDWKLKRIGFYLAVRGSGSFTLWFDGLST